MTAHWYYNCREIIDEVMESIGAENGPVNWNDYDRNNDGYIDGVYVVLRTRLEVSAANFVMGTYDTRGEKLISKLAFIEGVGIMKYFFNWIEPLHIDQYGETNVSFASFSD